MLFIEIAWLSLLENAPKIPTAWCQHHFVHLEELPSTCDGGISVLPLTKDVFYRWSYELLIYVSHIFINIMMHVLYNSGFENGSYLLPQITKCVNNRTMVVIPLQRQKSTSHFINTIFKIYNGRMLNPVKKVQRKILYHTLIKYFISYSCIIHWVKLFLWIASRFQISFTSPQKTYATKEMASSPKKFAPLNKTCHKWIDIIPSKVCPFS